MVHNTAIAYACRWSPRESLQRNGRLTKSAKSVRAVLQPAERSPELIVPWISLERHDPVEMRNGEVVFQRLPHPGLDVMMLIEMLTDLRCEVSPDLMLVLQRHGHVVLLNLRCDRNRCGESRNERATPNAGPAEVPFRIWPRCAWCFPS